MRKYSVSVLRRRLAEALDEADRGRPVLIERNGVTYRVSVERGRRRASRASPAIEVLDAAVAEGTWTWKWTSAGLRFTRPRR
jgi:hypothetical protein